MLRGSCLKVPKKVWDWGQSSQTIQSVIIGLTKDTRAISVTEKVVHLQNHISPCAAPLSVPGLSSTAGQSGIRRFVDTELNGWHQQCRQTARQAKRFTSLSPLDSTPVRTTGQEAIPQNGCAPSELFVPDCNVSATGEERQRDSDVKKRNVSLAAHAV